MFLSMISSAAHPRWALRPPSLILFPLIFWPTVYWSDFLVAHWSDWRKVPFDDQRCRSSNMATMAAILELVSVNYLTNACVDWSDFLVAHWGVINLHHIPLLPKPYLPYTQTTSHSSAYATPCVALVFTCIDAVVVVTNGYW
jgi:hypothetical protein